MGIVLQISIIILFRISLKISSLCSFDSFYAYNSIIILSKLLENLYTQLHTSRYTHTHSYIIKQLQYLRFSSLACNPLFLYYSAGIIPKEHLLSNFPKLFPLNSHKPMEGIYLSFFQYCKQNKGTCKLGLTACMEWLMRLCTPLRPSNMQQHTVTTHSANSSCQLRDNFDKCIKAP